MIIGGYDVHFPFKPYASQIGIASRVLKALDTGTNALLESPTGSGKSLALLCAAMEAWELPRICFQPAVGLCAGMLVCHRCF